MGITQATIFPSITIISSPRQKRKVNNDTSSINTVTTTDSTNYPNTTSSWKDELNDLKQESNENMKQLINENNSTITKTLNENINEKFKEFQTTLMETVEDMIAKQLSIINLNMINSIQGTLTHHTLHNTTPDGIQGPANNISQSPLTQPPTLEDPIDNEPL